MGESTRVQRLNRMLLKDLGQIFQQQGHELFGNPMISVTNVQVSPDLGIAKVYLSFLEGKSKKELVNEINLRKSEVRGILGSKIGKQVRKVPDLIFYHDNTAETAARMDDLLSKLDIPEEGKNYNLKGYKEG